MEYGVYMEYLMTRKPVPVNNSVQYDVTIKLPIRVPVDT